MGCLFPNSEGHDDGFERFLPIVMVTFTVPLYSTAASSLTA